MEKLTEIKSRLLQFAKTEGLTKEKFYSKIGIDGANFRGKNAESDLGSEKIVSILRVFPELNPDWLMLGNGEMYRKNGEFLQESSTSYVKIPTDVWEAIKLQTASLKEKDAQISRLIGILEGKTVELVKQ